VRAAIVANDMEALERCYQEGGGDTAAPLVLAVKLGKINLLPTLLKLILCDSCNLTVLLGTRRLTKLTWILCNRCSRFFFLFFFWLFSDPFLSQALHMACSVGSAEAVELLLESGADPTLRDSRDQTAYHLCKNKQTRLVLRRFAGENPDK